MTQLNHETPPVLISTENSLMTITLNRPKAINSLTLEMIQLIQNAMNQAKLNNEIRLILLMGTGERGFCAGADVKAAVKAIDENRKKDAMQFFIEEYALDLSIHQFPKPVIALAHGITMGGGLGLTAGADIVIATETTRMAMPETRIGFIPDVGATGWLFDKCPKGYPEYLGLTGYEIEGTESLRLGLAHELILNKDVPEAIKKIKDLAKSLNQAKKTALNQIKECLCPLFEDKTRVDNPDLDQWVSDVFSGKSNITDIIATLSNNTSNKEQCEYVLNQLSERSPTATVLTLNLLRQNENKSLDDVFSSETKACDFIVSHPDYREGVRARLIDKDNAPRWQPDVFDKVGDTGVDITP